MKKTMKMNFKNYWNPFNIISDKNEMENGKMDKDSDMFE